jgi:hypothetical protein
MKIEELNLLELVSLRQWAISVTNSKVFYKVSKQEFEDRNLKK